MLRFADDDVSANRTMRTCVFDLVTPRFKFKSRLTVRD